MHQLQIAGFVHGKGISQNKKATNELKLFCLQSVFL